jgi:hypothetical protein
MAFACVPHRGYWPPRFSIRAWGQCTLGGNWPLNLLSVALVCGRANCPSLCISASLTSDHITSTAPWFDPTSCRSHAAGHRKRALNQAAAAVGSQPGVFPLLRCPPAVIVCDGGMGERCLCRGQWQRPLSPPPPRSPPFPLGRGPGRAVSHTFWARASCMRIAPTHQAVPCPNRGPACDVVPRVWLHQDQQQQNSHHFSSHCVKKCSSRRRGVQTAAA